MQSVGDLKPHCKYRFVTINSWYCFFGNYIGLKTTDCSDTCLKKAHRKTYKKFNLYEKKPFD